MLTPDERLDQVLERMRASRAQRRSARAYPANRLLHPGWPLNIDADLLNLVSSPPLVGASREVHFPPGHTASARPIFMQKTEKRMQALRSTADNQAAAVAEPAVWRQRHLKECKRKDDAHTDEQEEMTRRKSAGSAAAQARGRAQARTTKAATNQRNPKNYQRPLSAKVGRPRTNYQFLRQQETQRRFRNAQELVHAKGPRLQKLLARRSQWVDQFWAEQRTKARPRPTTAPSARGARRAAAGWRAVGVYA